MLRLVWGFVGSWHEVGGFGYSTTCRRRFGPVAKAAMHAGYWRYVAEQPYRVLGLSGEVCRFCGVGLIMYLFEYGHMHMKDI